MAKLKYSPRSRSAARDAFDLTGNLFASDPEITAPAAIGPRELEIHPSIAEFAVNARAERLRSVANPHELDARSIQPHGERLTFISFGSGSSGNCAWLGTRREGILIDAGVHADTVIEQLHRHGIDPRVIKGIILTHDHTDHIKYVYPLVRKRQDVGVYCTPKTLTGILRRHSISRRIRDYHRPVYKEFSFNVGPFRITPFDVSHDGTDNAGYFIEYAATNTTIAVATDLGCITPRVDFYMRQADHIIIESNYDASMLAHGPYPMHLKARIAADNGHLDNVETARFIASIASPRLRSIYLCHLSHENNLPELAVEATLSALAEAGYTEVGNASGSITDRDKPLQLTALPRTEPSLLFTLR